MPIDTTEPKGEASATNLLRELLECGPADVKIAMDCIKDAMGAKNGFASVPRALAVISQDLETSFKKLEGLSAMIRVIVSTYCDTLLRLNKLMVVQIRFKRGLVDPTE